jgi:2-iminobutanoate/2-iminopropanoate deaminase
MKRQVIETLKAPTPAEPGSQAIRLGELIFVGMQTGVVPAGGEPAGQDAAAQAHRALCNLQAILESASSSLAGALRVTIYLTDMEDFAAVNAEYEHFFPADPPARSTVGVSALPDGALVGVEAVAHAH